jgi:hypothetical protein
MSIQSLKINAMRDLDKKVDQFLYPNSSQYISKANSIKKDLKLISSECSFQMFEAQECAKNVIQECLSELTSIENYPYRGEGCTLICGDGPSTITITIDYSGISNWFFGIWKSKKIQLKLTVHYGVKEEEWVKSFSVFNKQKNSKHIAIFLKSVVGYVYQIASELSKENPLYNTNFDFESELVLKVSSILDDPKIASIYIQLKEVEELKNEYQKKLDLIIEDTQKSIDKIEEEGKSLKAKIHECGDTYNQKLLDRSEKSKKDLFECAEKYKDLIKKEAEKCIEDAEIVKLKEEKAKLNKELKKIRNELKEIEDRKSNIPQVTKDILISLDRWFPDYDFGRNNKWDEEDVTPHLRIECALKIGKAFDKDPNIKVAQVISVFEFLIRSVRRSAGQKFNGKDLRIMTEEACWILANLKFDDVKWMMEKLKKYYYTRRNISDIHSWVVSFVPEEK